MNAQYVMIALIPAYEPDDKLNNVLKSVAEKGFRCFVVDDGSGEKYKPVFDKSSEYAEVISYEGNKGKGYALKTGLKLIRERFAGQKYSVVTLDSDGQHSSDDAERVCAESIKNPGTLVLGSRKFSGNVPRKSKFGNSITRFVYGITTGVKIRDTQTGLRAFTDDLVDLMLDVSGERYEYEMNVLLELPLKGKKIKEMDIETIYYDNNSGTHFSPVKDSFRIYKEIIKFSASSLASFCVDFLLYSLFCFAFLGRIRYGLTVSNISARILSASFNFTVNRKIVFKSDKKLSKSALEYFMLAAFILAGNTLMLNMLVNGAAMNKYAAKILTEIFFFVFSWFIQRIIVFKKAKKDV